MLMTLYVIGYLFVGIIVAKITMYINKDSSYKSINDQKEQATIIGVTWIFIIPMLVMIGIVGGIVYIIIEGGKKIL